MDFHEASSDDLSVLFVVNNEVVVHVVPEIDG